MHGSDKKIDQAFILAAGFGTRLRPLTIDVPKSMVPIAPGKPLLEHTIELLRDQGVSNFVINIHYLPEVIVNYFGDGKKLGVNIEYSLEKEYPLETGGALKKAAPLLRDNFYLLYADELHFFDMPSVAAKHFETGALATIGLKSSEVPSDGEVAEFDPVTGKIFAWHVRPHGIMALDDRHMMNSAIKAVSKRIIDYVTEPVGTPVKLDAQVFPRALAAGELLIGMPTDEKILDIGTPEKYQKAQDYYRDRSAKDRADKRHA